MIVFDDKNCFICASVECFTHRLAIAKVEWMQIRIEVAKGMIGTRVPFVSSRSWTFFLRP